MIFSTRRKRLEEVQLEAAKLVLTRDEIIRAYHDYFGLSRSDVEYILDQPDDYQSAVKYVFLKQKLREKQRAYRKARLNRISKRWSQR